MRVVRVVRVVRVIRVVRVVSVTDTRATTSRLLLTFATTTCFRFSRQDRCSHLEREVGQKVVSPCAGVARLAARASARGASGAYGPKGGWLAARLCSTRL